MLPHARAWDVGGYILHNIYDVLYSIYYILYTIYCILHTIYYTLYTISAQVPLAPLWPVNRLAYTLLRRSCRNAPAGGS